MVDEHEEEFSPAIEHLNKLPSLVNYARESAAEHIQQLDTDVIAENLASAAEQLPGLSSETVTDTIAEGISVSHNFNLQIRFVIFAETYMIMNNYCCRMWIELTIY